MTEQAVDRREGRRDFLAWFLGSTIGALAVAVLYPVARYLVPPKISESTADTVTLDIAPADLDANSGQIFRFGSQPGILVRTPAGELRAFAATCTHLNCIVQYRPDISHIWCACHDGHFDLTGRNIQGPPPRPLDRFDVNVQAGQIVVRRE